MRPQAKSPTMLECPNCGEILAPIIITTPAGGKITVDHCLNCSGTWFDYYEINRISYADVFKIAAITILKKRDIPFFKAERLCPRDFETLQLLKPEVLDDNLKIERCPKCHGVFVSQKILEKIKIAQNSKINTFKRLGLPLTLNTVFIPVVFVGLLLFTTFLTVTKLQDAKESEIRAKGQISSVLTIPVNSHTETILFLTSSPLITQIEYGTNLIDQKSINVSTTPSNSHQVVLKDLKENTTYQFRIILISQGGQKDISAVFAFTTSK